MAKNYALAAKRSEQAQESDALKIEEGETLCYLVPFERENDGLECHWIPVEMYGGKVYVELGRSAINFAHELTQNALWQKAYGGPAPETCPIAPYVEGLGPKDAKDASPREKFAWVIVPLFYRRKPSQEFQDSYTKPKWSLATRGNAKSPGMHGALEACFNSNPGCLPNVFDPTKPQLVNIKRTGTGRNNTKWEASLADGEFASYEVPAEILGDIEAATAEGGNCDLFQLLAGSFAPSQEELDEKLYGKSGKSKGGMEE